MDTHSGKEQDIRSQMTIFWQGHAEEASEEKMILDSAARELSQEEVPEILQMLPDVTGKRILELGAGIGRFTGHLAEKAKSIMAVDFMQSFIEESKRRNGGHKNIEFKVGDVTCLDLDNDSFDIIFSNWLFMYLSDEEVQALVGKMLRWLTSDGKLFFRESCFHQAGDSPGDSNPTIYRTPVMYSDLVKSVIEASMGFEIEFIKPVKTYIKMKKNNCQLCWLMHKIKREDSKTGPFQEQLDSYLYTKSLILSYEKIFGKTFVSVGGKETTEELTRMLELKPGQTVLDVGCGIGGSAFYMTDHYGAMVRGIDLSVNMVEIALEQQRQRPNCTVLFEVGDATKVEFPENSFDVCYSRDTIAHIKDKLALFRSMLKWLKPGGRLMITDYCCGQGQLSEQFKNYVAYYGYSFLDLVSYGKTIEAAGFVQVKVTDFTDRFVQALKTELGKMEEQEAEFCSQFGKEEVTRLKTVWQNKVVNCGRGDQRWGLFQARKPAV